MRIIIADRPSRCIADRGTAEAEAQQQQHSSSGGSDVAATGEKDEHGHTAKFFVNHCCFTVPLNTLRLHARQQYICSDFVFWCFVEHLGLSFESFTVQAVRRVFPRLLPCVSLANVLPL